MSDLVPTAAPVIVALPMGLPANCKTNWLKSFGHGSMDAGLDRLLNVVPHVKAVALRRQGALGGALICAAASCAILAGVIARCETVKKQSEAVVKMKEEAANVHFLMVSTDEGLEKSLMLLREHGFPDNRVLTEIDPDGKPSFKIEFLTDDVRFDEIASLYETMHQDGRHDDGEEDRT